MTDTTSKVAIVTGASGGIGAAIAQRLARDGFTVVVNYASNAGPAEALVAKIESAGGRAVAAQADIADPAAVARLFDTAEAAFGGVDVVVNNAGMVSYEKTLVRQLRELLETNPIGAARWRRCEALASGSGDARVVYVWARWLGRAAE